MNDPQHNPYAPPKAPVAETPDKAPADAPPVVRTAMKLLWLTFFMSFVELALDWEGITRDVPLVFTAIWMTGLCALQVWLFLMIARGRNWARITWLVIVAILMPLTIGTLIEMEARAPIAAVVVAIDLFLGFIALYLLFIPGRAWFRQRS